MRQWLTNSRLSPTFSSRSKAAYTDTSFNLKSFLHIYHICHRNGYSSKLGLFDRYSVAIFSGTGNIIFRALKIGKNNPEIANLEFENHGFLKNHVFLPTEQAGTNICSMVYQDINFKICLSLFGWKENILPKQHIVQWWYHPPPRILPYNIEFKIKLKWEKEFSVTPALL